MKLNSEQIKSITTGAVKFTEEEGNLHLWRFTEEQEAVYGKGTENVNNKIFSTAGIRLLFKTDADSMNLKVSVKEGSSRKYFSFDIAVDGDIIGYIDNVSDKPCFVNGELQEFELGGYSKSFELGSGEKTVCVYFPWSVGGIIEELSLENCTFIEAVKPEKKLLAFGDSITQGYDAVRPSNRYVARLADKLGVEEFNKAVGGEVFIPALVKLPEDFVPDYITVAYGTNDWSLKTEDDFKVRCKDFYTALSKNYPHSKIFAITPIWRKDHLGERKFGLFENVEKDIKEAVENLENVTVISGFDFVPEDEKYFADLRLHPNDDGFAYYADSLYKKIKSEIK